VVASACTTSALILFREPIEGSRAAGRFDPAKKRDDLFRAHESWTRVSESSRWWSELHARSRGLNGEMTFSPRFWGSESDGD
jgi:hypothetical protein